MHNDISINRLFLIKGCKSIVLSFIIVFSIYSCKKDHSNNLANIPTISTGIEIGSNVKVIDTSLMQLNYPLSQIADGRYVYKFNGSISISKNDIVVGTEGEGYIRRVSNVNIQGNLITLETTPGTLEDVFKSGKINLTFNLDDLSIGKRSAFNHHIDNLLFYNENGVKLTLNNTDIKLKGEMGIDLEFNHSGIDHFSFSTGNSSFGASGELKYECVGDKKLFDMTDTLLRFKPKKIILWVEFVPIVLTLDMNLMHSYTGKIVREINNSTKFNLDAPLKLGLNYINGQWSSSSNFNSTFSAETEQFKSKTQFDLSYSFVPHIAVRLYGVAGPFGSIAPTVGITATIESTTSNWDVKAQGWAKATLGADIAVLGKKIIECPPQAWVTSKILLYNTPNNIAIVSIGNDGQIKVQISDSKQRPQADINVLFKLKKGSGNIFPNQAISDASGFANTRWTPSSENEDEILQVIIKDGSGSSIEKDTLLTIACQKTVTDIDGNIYHVIRIGNQCWLKENLTTTKFIDGEDIKNITDTMLWQKYQLPAWCYYENNISNKKLGKLYNVFVIKGNHKICPEGYKVPTKKDWLTLVNYLGGENDAAPKLRNKTGWRKIGTDSSGFAAYPGYGDNNYSSQSGTPIWSQHFYDNMGVFRYINPGLPYGFLYIDNDLSNTQSVVRFLDDDYDDDGSQNQITAVCIRCILDK